MANEALDIRYDVAQGLDRGERPYQEDCIASDFSIGEPGGFCILADGMGAHSAGDLASAVVVSGVYSYLKAKKNELLTGEAAVPEALRRSADIANTAVAENAETRPDARGMGSTLIAYMITHKTLHWVSIGDSLLYLFRKGELTRLNDDHSMAPRIDAMVATGQISAAAAANHPERNVLTSAVVGQKLGKVDCPETGFGLEDGDILIASSDGLQSLKDAEIQKVIRRHGKREPSDLVRSLIEAVKERGVPDQDNLSMVIAQVDFNEAPSMPVAAPAAPAEKETPEIEEAPDFLKVMFS